MLTPSLTGMTRMQTGMAISDTPCNIPSNVVAATCGDTMASTPLPGVGRSDAPLITTHHPLPLCRNTWHQIALTLSNVIAPENGRPDGLMTLYPRRSTPTPYHTSGLAPSTCRRRPSRPSKYRHGSWPPTHTLSLASIPSLPPTPSLSLTATVRGTTTPTLYPASHPYATS